MSLETVVLLSCANVASRSSLNVLDRFVFSQSKHEFLRLYFFTSVFPLVLGIFILPFVATEHTFWSYFWTWPCLLLALVTQLAGMSFSYAFRHCTVRQVVIKAKMPELLFACASLIPFVADALPRYAIGLKTYCTLSTTLIGVGFLCLERNAKIFSFFDRTSLYIICSLAMQMICSSLMPIPATTLGEMVVVSVAMLLWRCCLMVPVLCVHHFSSYYKSDQVVDGWMDVAQSKNFFSILSVRAILALLTQVTFVWCILEGSPLLIWPIFNTTPLVSSIASQYILKEQPHWAEIMALLVFFVGSTCTVFL